MTNGKKNIYVKFVGMSFLNKKKGHSIMNLYIRPKIIFSVSKNVVDEKIYITSNYNSIKIKNKYIRKFFNLIKEGTVKTYIYKINSNNEIFTEKIEFKEYVDFMITASNKPIRIVYDLNNLYKEDNIITYKEMNKLLQINVYKKNQCEKIIYEEYLKIN